MDSPSPQIVTTDGAVDAATALVWALVSRWRTT